MSFSSAAPNMQGLPVREWRRGDFLLSTDTSLIDIDALNTAFASDAMPWAVKLPQDLLRTAINSSLCLGLYHSPEEPGSEAAPRRMLGLSRVVTDFVTFGYLTDVYVLNEFQGQGLGKWMLECLSEHIDQWPYLRRLLLVTITPQAAELYKKTTGVIEWSESPSARLILLEKRGGGSRV